MVEHQRSILLKLETSKNERSKCVKILCQCFLFVFLFIIVGCSNPSSSSGYDDDVMASDFLVSKVVCTGYQSKLLGPFSFSRDYYFQFSHRMIDTILGAKYPKSFALSSAYLTEEDYTSVVSNKPIIEIYSPIKGENSIVYNSRIDVTGQFENTGILSATITLGIDTVNEVVYEVVLYFRKSA